MSRYLFFSVLSATLSGLLIGGFASNAIQPAKSDSTPSARAQAASTDKLLPLPSPTGPHPVGTTVFHFVDSSRADTLAKQPGKFRELMVQVWYPANAPSSAAAAPYIPDPALLRALMNVEGGYYGQSPETLAWWKHLRTSSFWNIPVLRKGHPFPLLIFSPGLGISRINYTAYAQELASHGYIVAGVDHPYGGFTVLPDGRVLSSDDDPGNEDEKQMPAHLTQYAADAAFVVSELERAQPGAAVQFAEVIDHNKVGMFGHSLGGAAALETCRVNQRFKACADLDGAPFGSVTEEGVQKPTLLLLEDPDYSDADLAAKGRTRAQWEAMGKKGEAMWASLASSKNIPVYKVKIRGTGHLSFSDAPFVMPNTITRFGGHILDAQAAFDRVTTYLLAFFDEYLKSPNPSATPPWPARPNVTVERLDARH